jgi:hypothetical protein
MQQRRRAIVAVAFVVIVLSGVLGLFAQPDPHAAQTWAHVQQTLQQAGQ